MLTRHTDRLYTSRNGIIMANVAAVSSRGENMVENSDMPDTESLIQLFTNAIRNRMNALELENEALKMRLNEARLKLELARSKLEEAGIEVPGLEFDSNL